MRKLRPLEAFEENRDHPFGKWAAREGFLARSSAPAQTLVRGESAGPAERGSRRGDVLSYTGIKEIDDVLLDLYSEQAELEKKLRKHPDSRLLSQRHRRVVVLADRLLELGGFVQALDSGSSPSPA